MKISTKLLLLISVFFVFSHVVADVQYVASGEKASAQLKAGCTLVANNQNVEKKLFVPSLFNSAPPIPLMVQISQLVAKYQANTVEITETNFHDDSAGFGQITGTVGTIRLNLWQCRQP